MMVPTEVKSIMFANNLEEAKSILENCVPIKLNGEWFQADVAVYEKISSDIEIVWDTMRKNIDNLSKTTIQLCPFEHNQFAYLFYSH